MTATAPLLDISKAAPSPLALSDAGGARPAGGGLDTTADILGFDLWPWQAAVARVGLAREGGRWRYPVVVVVVPRQSGKTRLGMAVCVDRCLESAGCAGVVHGAVSDGRGDARWRELVRLLRRVVVGGGLEPVERRDGRWDFRVRWAMGTEEIEFANGSQLRIFAPAEDSLHGSVTDLVVLDEARFFDS